MGLHEYRGRYGCVVRMVLWSRSPHARPLGSDPNHPGVSKAGKQPYHFVTLVATKIENSVGGTRVASINLIDGINPKSREKVMRASPAELQRLFLGFEPILAATNLTLASNQPHPTSLA